jgi:hypothetical protein
MIRILTESPFLREGKWREIASIALPGHRAAAALPKICSLNLRSAGFTINYLCA